MVAPPENRVLQRPYARYLTVRMRNNWLELLQKSLINGLKSWQMHHNTTYLRIAGISRDVVDLIKVARCGLPFRRTVAKPVQPAVPDGVDSRVHEVQHLRRSDHRVVDSGGYLMNLEHHQHGSLTSRLEAF